jgi:hypothetical protein
MYESRATKANIYFFGEGDGRPDDGGGKYLCNIDKRFLGYAAQHSRRQSSSDD